MKFCSDRKQTYKKKTIINLLFLTIIYAQTSCASRSESSRIGVRVLLKEIPLKKSCEVALQADKQLILSSPNFSQKILLKNKKIRIIFDGNSFFVNFISPKTKIKKLKKINPKEITVLSKAGNIKIYGKRYAGSINLKIDLNKKTLFIINKLNLNNYIKGVLPSEIFPSWKFEMQKVQALISKSYVLYHILQARKNKKPYDIRDNNFHQNYSGFNSYKNLEKAIKETSDLIITYKGEVALTMFDACCGGVQPNKVNYLDFKKAEYLARSRVCNFCKSYNLYKWHKEISESDFLRQIKKNYLISRKLSNAGRLVKVIIHKKDAAGIVNQLKLFLTRKEVVIPASKVRDCMRNTFRSLNFQIKKHRDKIIVDGKGYGHQLGLCQRGAKELVDRGWNYKNIIRFYYPGINFSRLKKYAKV